MNKRNILVFFILILLLGLSGCSRVSTPEQLINRPENNVDLDDISMAVKQNLSENTTLIVPKSSQNAAAINLVDIDADNENEVVAFFEQQEISLKIGFMILKKVNNSWQKISENTGAGYDIDYASFQDLNGDGSKEIIVSWDNGKSNKLKYIYYFEKLRMKEIFVGNYDFINVEKTSIDNSLRIIVSKFDSVKNGILMNLYRFNLQGVVLLDTNVIPYKANVSSYDIFMGSVTEKSRAIFITQNSYEQPFTEIIELNKDEFHKLVDIPYEDYIGFEDINEDDIQEFAYKHKSSEINSWFKYDKRFGFIPFLMNIYNYDLGYRFDFPKNWKDTVKTKTIQDGENENVVFYHINKLTDKEEVIFKILIIDNDQWEKKKNEILSHYKTNVFLGRKNSKAFVGLADDDLKDFITINELKRNFRIIY